MPPCMHCFKFMCDDLVVDTFPMIINIFGTLFYGRADIGGYAF